MEIISVNLSAITSFGRLNSVWSDLEMCVSLGTKDAMAGNNDAVHMIPVSGEGTREGELTTGRAGHLQVGSQLKQSIVQEAANLRT